MRLWRGILIGLLLQAGIARGAEPTPISGLRALTREEAAAGREVTVKGVITLVWRRGTQAWVVQDETAGIWVNFRLAQDRGIWKGDPETAAGLRQGDVVELVAVTDPGGFSPALLPCALRITGEAELPPPAEVRPEDLLGGSADSQRVRLRGVVRDAFFIKPRLFMQVESEFGPVTVHMSSPVRIDPAAWLDAEVEITGVAATMFNGRSEFMGLNLLTRTDEDVRIIDPPAVSATTVPLMDLARFSPAGRPKHRVRIEGTVTLFQAGEHLFLQEGAQGIRVSMRSSETLVPGDRVEATGFVGYSGVVAGMVNAQVRKIGSSAPPEPIPFDQKILGRAFGPMDVGLRAAPSDFDALLVKTEATLLAMQTDPAGSTRLVLEVGTGICLAIVPASAADRERLADLRIGSRLGITGITQLDYLLADSPRLAGRPKGFGFLLRNAGDITVIRAASWWTQGRIRAALGMVAAVLTLALLWVWLLHRQVRAQSAQIAAEIKVRGDAAVEFQATLRERNRLAANLHDTLLQTLGGIRFQIDACEISARQDETKTLPALDVARRMVDHAVNELRGSVWTLRSMPLHGRTFPEALEALAETVATSAGHRATVTVEVEGSAGRIPEFVAGNILLIVQEALYNALRHGRPRTIRILARTGSGSAPITVTIRDDGSGFEPGMQAGPAQGHFGLTGIAERAERLGGSARITSSPGAGTTVEITVARHAFDSEVA